MVRAYIRKSNDREHAGGWRDRPEPEAICRSRMTRMNWHRGAKIVCLCVNGFGVVQTQNCAMNNEPN